MILLILFAFLAGFVTILSPCILPILPIVLSSSIGGKETGKSRPIGVITGFILSFTFFTLFLSTIVNLSGIPGDSLRMFSVIAIGLFGISYLIPRFQILLEKLFSSLTRFMPQGNTKTGFWPGLLVGFAIGLLWTPCVGPILASVISLAITGSVTVTAFLITIAYSIGTAIPMFAVMLGGQSLFRKIPWLLNNSANIQKGFGVMMILTAIAIYNNYDRKFQTYILESFPQYGAGLTQFEDNNQIRDELGKLQNKTNNDSNKKNEDLGKPTFNMQAKGPRAPEIIPGGRWFNTDPLTLEKLKGKVVVIDFWTYTCINCQRTLPYLKKWHDLYSDKGLVIIGVHAPEFEFEKNESNVRKAVADFGIKYAVVQDNDFATWRAYDNSYWPAKYFIDKDGYIRYTHFGEGAYDESERVIQDLLNETGAKDISKNIENPTYQNYAQTHETYLGYWRIDNFSSNEQIVEDEIYSYTSPSSIPDNKFAFTGKWTVMRQYANPQKGSVLNFNFSAKEVFLVMRPKGNPGKVKVFLDNKQQFLGEDVLDGVALVNSDKLYKLIKLPNPGRHILRLEFEDSNTEIYAFTFG